MFSPTFAQILVNLAWKNESRNAKIYRLIKRSIIRWFNETEPLKSNLSKILKQWMSLLHSKMIREKSQKSDC